jgi:hypothetical protein
MADPVERLEENSSEITNISNEANSTSVSLIDLQRLKAEYENYKKRVERDRSVTHDLAVSSVLTALLPIMDDIDRAQSHGELTGGFKAVGEQIKIATERIGLEKRLIQKARTLVDEDHFTLDKLLNRTEQDLQKIDQEKKELFNLLKENGECISAKQ